VILWFALYAVSAAGVVWASSAVSLLILMSPLLILRRGRLRMSRADVAAAFGPFVVLFGEDGADEADQRGWEDATTSVRRRISRFSRSWGCWTRFDATAPWGRR
jgi:hypothetical protein